MTVYDHVMKDVGVAHQALIDLIHDMDPSLGALLNELQKIKRGLLSARSQLVRQQAEIVKHRERYAKMQARIAHLERELHYEIWGHMPDEDEDGEPIVDESSIRTWGEQ